MKTAREYIEEYNEMHKECDAVYHAAALRLGLSDCAFWILYTVYSCDMPWRQSELCEHFHLSRQTVNSALKKLEKDGLLELNHQAGVMGKSICLTKSGRQFALDKIEPVIQAETRACEAFSEEEIETFMSLLHRLTERLGQEINPQKEE